MEHRKQTDLLDEAAKYFATQLWSKAGEPARKYLLGRGFTEKTLREAGWGFCRSDRGLHGHLQKSKADMSNWQRNLGLIRADGLDFTANGDGAKASPDGYIIYPHTWNGKTTYFSARALKPKDPNDKSRNLPGERQVYWALVPGDPNLIIVEGQSDAESLRSWVVPPWHCVGWGTCRQEIERVQKRRVVYLALDNDLHKTKLTSAEQDKVRKRKALVTRRLCEALGALTMIVPDLPAKDMNEWLQNGLTLQILEKHLSNCQTLAGYPDRSKPISIPCGIE
jgi:5S rRNA maturation endonuclease (ribonuclease M5)